MTEYKLSLSGPELVTLYENEDRILMCGINEAESIGFVRNIDKYDYMTEYEPTDGFWRDLVHAEMHTMNLSHEISKMNVNNEVIPHPDYWGLLKFTETPRYEAKIIEEIQYRMFLYKINNKNNHLSIPEPFTNVVKEAYQQHKGEIPKYLE